MLEPPLRALSREINSGRGNLQLYILPPEASPLRMHSQAFREEKGRGRPFWESLGNEGGELCYL